MNWTEEEHYHSMEEEHIIAQFVPLVPCRFEQGSGDKRWPVLCQIDMRYATRRQCDTCGKRRP